ncbi:mannose-1-phosphate guanylyltransferase/mannose-6-phosphate isomerase [Cecembia lonarensis]|uniref:Mannose-1-phosphate guanylyltransferase/mannose-6-phosphate isomerase n=1 Tax=Cecembia lonarensis (strain CCUG 58316 / KCTC 22772 / LW9) TaxID=1225176 RepID=K1M536_CECL9|nr:mannose-1-phosphate guanylyltransferase/mannose-6-phosphate isomerase [Cecembia lonarensis]EKB51309.1 mannose-1-phosphate guanylyltransferase/mannose-6-phosphate isomerase [Cecembia lonarensis LW9]
METKFVIIQESSNQELLGANKRPISKAFLPKAQGKSPFEIAVEVNKGLYDSLMIVGQISNFKYSRSLLMKIGIYNYEEIIEACSKNTAADFAFAAFASSQEDVLFVTNPIFSVPVNDYYNNTLRHAKRLADQGDIVVVDFYKEELSLGKKDHEDLLQRVYCFKASTFLDELLKHEPDTYYATKRAHFKKSGSFINEILNDLIPSHSIEEAVIDKSDKVKGINAFINVNDHYQINNFSSDQIAS